VGGGFEGGKIGEGFPVLLIICEYIALFSRAVACVDPTLGVNVEFCVDLAALEPAVGAGEDLGDVSGFGLAFLSFVFELDDAFASSRNADDAAAFSASCFFLWFWQNLTSAFLGTDTKHFFPPSTCSQN